MRELPARALACALRRGGEAMGAGWRVPSWGASTIGPSGGMTLPRSEPDPYACASEGAAVADALAAGDRSARSRGGLRLVAASDRDASGAIVDEDAERAPERDHSSDAAWVRRLRLARPVQLELVSAREGPPPELVWALLPERAREAVLVLLARLIGSGAVWERA